jgi:hypothetical protein
VSNFKSKITGICIILGILKITIFWIRCKYELLDRSKILVKNFSTFAKFLQIFRTLSISIQIQKCPQISTNFHKFQKFPQIPQNSKILLKFFNSQKSLNSAKSPIIQNYLQYSTPLLPKNLHFYTKLHLDHVALALFLGSRILRGYVPFNSQTICWSFAVPWKLLRANQSLIFHMFFEQKLWPLLNVQCLTVGGHLQITVYLRLISGVWSLWGFLGTKRR